MSVKAHELTEHPEFWAAEINKMNGEIDRLRARLAEIEGQEPISVVVSDGYSADGYGNMLYDFVPIGTKVYAAPVPPPPENKE